jgi:hypothetical protein
LKFAAEFERYHMPYSTPFPANMVLADVNAAVSDRIAQALHAGQNLHSDHLAQAKQEVALREALGPQCTVDELVSSDIRLHALLSEHASQRYPSAGAPAWFVAAMATLDQRLDQINGRMDQMNGRMDQMNGRMDQMNGQVSAVFHNSRAYARNRQSMISGVSDAPLYPLMKTRPGAGNGFPGAAPGQLLAVVPLPGTMVGAPFPARIDQLRTLSAANLCRLADFFNDDFGIVQGDKQETRRDKFLKFIVGE